MITLLLVEIAVEPGWAVGTVPLDDPALDRDLLVDVDGHPWVPGSSLAGSLRSHLRATNGAAADTALMGSHPATSDAQTTVSRLWLLGTRFTPTDAAPAHTEIVGQTRIDRTRGAGAATSLRYSRSVASGGILTAYLRVDGELTPGELAAIATWKPAIGRGRTTGSGRARLRGLRSGTVDPTTPDGMRLWLTHHGPDLVEAVAHTTTALDVSSGEPQPWLQADLLIEDALLVGESTATGPTRHRHRAGVPIIPGSAWKGVIRSRVEYILRSRYGDGAVCDGGTWTDTLGHEPGEVCGTCPVCETFGHQGRRGRLVFSDSRIEGCADPMPRTQVAIDRVTGGARHGLLFTSQPVTTGRIRLRIHTLDPVDDWVRPAVEHVLFDLHDGLIGIGSRVTRGMGTLRLAQPPPRPAPVSVASLDTTPVPTQAMS